MLASLVTGPAQVVVNADNALVPEANDGNLVASVTGDPRVSRSNSRFHLSVFSLYGVVLPSYLAAE